MVLLNVVRLCFPLCLSITAMSGFPLAVANVPMYRYGCCSIGPSRSFGIERRGNEGRRVPPLEYPALGCHGGAPGPLTRSAIDAGLRDSYRIAAVEWNGKSNVM